MKIEKEYVKTQIWDTCGQERYRALTTAYYRNAVGALLIYDITDRNSFENIKKWMSELKENADSASPVLILVGNKCDLESERAVRKQEAQKFAESQSKYPPLLIYYHLNLQFVRIVYLI